MATPMEHDAIVGAFKGNDGASKSVAKVFRHWGKSEVYNDCKALLSSIAASKDFKEGEAFVPVSAEFALAKCMVASQRTENGGADEGRCYCLPSLFLAGCRHKPGIITPRKSMQDIMCHHCSKCVRCQGLPSCIISNNTYYQPQESATPMPNTMRKPYYQHSLACIQGCAKRSRRTSF